MFVRSLFLAFLLAISANTGSVELAPLAPKLAFKCEAYEAYGITSKGTSHEASKFNPEQGSLFLVHHNYWPIEGKRRAAPSEIREDLSTDEALQYWLKANYQIELRDSYLTMERNAYLVRRTNLDPKNFESGYPSSCVTLTYQKTKILEDAKFSVSCQNSGQAFIFNSSTRRYKHTISLLDWPSAIKEGYGETGEEMIEQQVTYFGYCEEYYP